MSLDKRSGRKQNGSVVRKHLGYSHIPRRFAQRVNDFSINVLSPYLSFHWPWFPEEVDDAEGKRRKRYPYANLMPPTTSSNRYPKPLSTSKPGIIFQHPDDIAMQHS